MKNKEKLNEALNNIDDKMIETAYARQVEKRSLSGLFGKIGYVAAVAAIVAFAIVLSQFAHKKDNIAGTTTITEETETTAIGDYEVEPGVCKRGQIWGDYIFRYTEQGSLKKYNIHTGEKSDAIPGSLIVTSWASIGNILYYTKDDCEANESTLYAYDAGTSELQTVFTEKGMLSVYEAYEERLLMSYTSDSYRNADHYYFWYDTQTGKTTQISNRYIADGYMMEEIKDDRIVWRYMGSIDTPAADRIYYSTDLNGTDYKKYNFGYYYGNHYKEVLETDEDGNVHDNLYVTFAGETEEKLLIADVYLPLFAENKIIYTKSVPKDEQRVAYIDESKKKNYDHCNGDVYIMNPDGSDDHLLFHTDECISSMNDTLNSRNWYVSKDYVAMFSEYELPERGLLERVIIVNINTGEFVVEHEAEIVAVPDDFSFSLVWGTYGISSYDSKTGTLIKTSDATDVSKYTTAYKMNDRELTAVYNLLIQLKDYPDNYDPYNDPASEIQTCSEPNRTVIIKFTSDGIEKTITCKDICYGVTGGYDDAANKFLQIEKQIENLLTNTKQWQTLPEYEVFYD